MGRDYYRNVEKYFEDLENAAKKCYEIGNSARKLGLDPAPEVEIPTASDLAERVEQLLRNYDVKGVAERIKQLSKDNSRESVALLIAQEIAESSKGSREEAMEKAIRVGIAVLTEGILVAPLEGISKVKIMQNHDGSEYAAVFYAGPIRSAGGTATAMSVLIADVVRRKLGLGRYIPTEDEIERYKEEVPLYKRAQHLQYTPTPQEIETIVRNCPICIDGEPTEKDYTVSKKGLKRFETDYVRGGACLVIAEGLCLKAAKLKKHIDKLKIDGWEFLNTLIKVEKDAGKIEPSEKYIKEIVGGRPIFSHPSRKGGFRLRYGRTRTTGIAALAVNPVSMHIVNDFIAIGTQLKIERPGKAAALTPCDLAEGPMVLLTDGSFIQLNDLKDYLALNEKIVKIVDLGEILVPFGEFFENNHPLMPGTYAFEWWIQEVLEKTQDYKPQELLDLTPEDAFRLSQKYDVPLSPAYNLFWHDVNVKEINTLSEYVEKNGKFENGKLKLPHNPEIKEILLKLGALHTVTGGNCVLDRYGYALVRCLGLEVKEGEIVRRVALQQDAQEPVSYVSLLAGVKIKAKSPTRIGTRMARPEKASERKMSPPVRVLFPIGTEGGTQRLFNDVEKDRIVVDIEIRVCEKCKTKQPLPVCANCGGKTKTTGTHGHLEINIHQLLEAAKKKIGGCPSGIKLKGVIGLVSKNKTPEIIEKGLLRAIHNVYVFRDGTVRYDMTDIPLTHFKLREIGLSIEKARELGYTKDYTGKEIVNEEQIIELLPQDIVPSSKCGDYLVKVAGFIDDLLEKVYNLPRFYNVKTREDLIGHLVVGLAPHTSVGVLGRIIGYTDVDACYAHPYYHAAKRRNCDGDEDSVMLLMDALLNFSFSYLPVTRGGLMDAPLVLTTRIKPDEIDKEVLNMDTYFVPPLALYRAAERFEHPKKLEIENVGRRVGTGEEYCNLGFVFDTTDISAGPRTTRYKTLETMWDKVMNTIELYEKLAGIDLPDGVRRVIEYHFMPDIAGNLKKFTTQGFRCPKCGEKYRRMTLTGKCTKVTNGEKCDGLLIFTVSEGSVKKYLQLVQELMNKFPTDQYLSQRFKLVDEAIYSIFGKGINEASGQEKECKVGLDKFM
ncbi:MAG: DNA polymerase II large subunit [Thermoplasmata archaeon]